MASTPEANPDSPPIGPSESPEQVSWPDDGSRENVENPSGGGSGADQGTDRDGAS